MNYQTARHLLIQQVQPVRSVSQTANPLPNPSSDTLLERLKQGKAPVPGQVTSVLLALKVVFEALRDATEIERELACALHILASESRRRFDGGLRSGVAWPPLLDEDLDRIAAAVNSIFCGNWT